MNTFGIVIYHFFSVVISTMNMTSQIIKIVAAVVLDLENVKH